MDQAIKTRVLALSDTHGDAEIAARLVGMNTEVDIGIHCGDLTEGAKLSEFQSALELLKGIKAHMKLVIAGNHDWALDEKSYTHHAAEYERLYPGDPDLFTRTYGAKGEAKALFQSAEARAAGVVFLDEGTHSFTLANGANLTVYASPFTCSPQASWGYQYTPSEEHTWSIPTKGIDIAMTHSPPKGVLDRISKERRREGGDPRAGSESLFTAIAKAKPKVHCFGHIHESWGARKVTWREDIDEDIPLTHFNAIDNSASETLYSLAQLQEEGEYPTIAEAKTTLETGETLFLNAALEELEKEKPQPAFLIEIPLSRAKQTEVKGSDSKSSKRRRDDEEDDDETLAKRVCC